MNFAVNHAFDFACILAGMAYGISTIGKISKNPRGLFLYRLSALFLLAGGALGLLHAFQNIDWVHRHHWALWLDGWSLKSVGLGMVVVILALGVHKDVMPRQKDLQDE